MNSSIIKTALEKVRGIESVYWNESLVIAVAFELHNVDWEAVVIAEDSLVSIHPGLEIKVRANQSRDTKHLFQGFEKIF
jgi:hypothetical protein